MSFTKNEEPSFKNTSTPLNWKEYEKNLGFQVDTFSSQLQFEITRDSKEDPFTYADLDLRQKQIQTGVLHGKPGTFLLSEVSPVITLGKRTPEKDLLSNPFQTPLYRTKRGGFATYHGWGQWILFPVESLEILTGDPKGVRILIEKLLQIALTVCQRWVPEAQIKRDCHLGVWGPRGKFASVGVQIDQKVVLHGLSINGFQTPESFQGLRPCGLDAQIDYLISKTQKDKEKLFLELQNQILEVTEFEFSRRS